MVSLPAKGRYAPIFQSRAIVRLQSTPTCVLSTNLHSLHRFYAKGMYFFPKIASSILIIATQPIGHAQNTALIAAPHFHFSEIRTKFQNFKILFMMKSLATIVLLLVATTMAMAQEAQPKPIIKAGFSGAASLTFAVNNTFMNMGGPNVRINYGKYGCSVGLYPSLRYNHDSAIPINQHKISTILGVGSALYFERYNLMYALYFPSTAAGVKAQSIHSFGIGIKLGK
jgi:hypothetical protein